MLIMQQMQIARCQLSITNTLEHYFRTIKVKVVMDQVIVGFKTLFVHFSVILYPQQIEVIFCLNVTKFVEVSPILCLLDFRRASYQFLNEANGMSCQGTCAYMCYQHFLPDGKLPRTFDPVHFYDPHCKIPNISNLQIGNERMIWWKQRWIWNVINF